VLVVGYPGQIDVFLAWLLSRLRRKPLVWDVFMSIYLIALERRLDQKSRLTIKLIYWLEKGALFLPDLLIQDTQQYVEWFNRNFGAHEDRFRLIPTGVDDRLFYQRENETGVPPKDIFTILYYGTFISNHGVDVIIEAARLLKDDHNIVFELIGDGPERERCEKKALSEELNHVRFINWLDQDELAMHIQRANLCLGVFGNTPQSLMTVQNKIYECLAMGKPLITGNGPAVDDAFKHCIHLFLCNRTPTSLAEGILTLKGDPKLRESLANTGRDYVVNNFGITKTGQRFREYLSALTYVSR
jgi:glycosyltransferase involved in cell wall biosynthesis